MDHLTQAKKSAAFVAEHADVPALTRPSSQIGIMHALIDIAESLRTQRPQTVTVDNKAKWNGGGIRIVHLADLPLEHVGTTDNNEQGN